MSSIWEDCVSTIEATIEGLTLDGFGGGSILSMAVADFDRLIGAGTGRPLPAIIVAPAEQEAIDPNAGTNLRDDVVYPVLIAFAAADNHGNPGAYYSYFLSWRETVRKALHNKTLSGLPSIIRVTIDARAAIIPDNWNTRGYISGGLIARCLSRESRS